MAKDEHQEAEIGLPSGLSKPAQRALAGAGISRLDQLAKLRESEVLRLHGMGPKAIDLLRRAMAARGLAFAVGAAEKGPAE